MTVIKIKKSIIIFFSVALVFFGVAADGVRALAPLPKNPQDGSVGVQGVIPTSAPVRGPTISAPGNGQSFSELPVTVSGLCTSGLLVKLFKNNVFAGSAQCTNGSYAIKIDLFGGSNELVARNYDALDQASPDSNTVSVTYKDKDQNGIRVSLTSNYAKRGANPGGTLLWPVVISGGSGPYAVSVDWGDGKSSDLFTQEFPGEFIMKHIYESPGIYNIVVKVVDKNGSTAFIQLVGVGNGPLSQTTGENGKASPVTTAPGKVQTQIILWPAFILIFLIVVTFWLGKRYEIRRLRRRIEEGRGF